MAQSLFILHSLNGNTKDSFKDNVTEIAEGLGYEVYYPIFAVSEESSFENFKEVMQRFESDITANSVFIAHSISANYLIKYIYDKKIKIRSLISVGGGLNYLQKKLQKTTTILA